jgi:predicted DNA-binding protein (MmcQ/YjbR family)
MNIEDLRKMCLGLPHVTEDIKWGNDLCFCIGEKMFCITGIDAPLKVSFKVKDEEFHDMSSRPNIVPAPYVARYKWVLVEEPHALSAKEWAYFIKQSYQLVKAGLSKKLLESLEKPLTKKTPQAKTRLKVKTRNKRGKAPSKKVAEKKTSKKIK